MEELTIRDTLFGDMPLSAWAGDDPVEQEAPWSRFAAAGRHLQAGEQAQAVDQLEKIVATPGLASRHYLQAWHFLRQLSIAPPDEVSKEVYGVVVEVGLTGGLDLMAAYADHSARYFNFSGAGVIWDQPDGSLNPEIDALLAAARRIIPNIGPWEQGRPPPPPEGEVRVNILTPSGLHFGQGPFEVLSADALGGPILNTALVLMQALVDKSSSAAS